MMIRKHAIVLALSFVLVGMMFLSVGTSLVLPYEGALENTQPHQEEMVIGLDGKSANERTFKSQL
jgi:hypothetical protein